MRKLILFATLALLVASGTFWSCQKEETLLQDEVALKSAVTDYVSWCAEPQAYKLIAGQTMDAGQLLVSNNGEYLKVEYVVNSLFTLGTVQLWVGTNPNDVPQNNQGVPVPGQFPYKGDAITGYVFYVPVPQGFDCTSTVLYIYAHAEVSEVSATTETHETAWSEGTAFSTNRWGFYSTYYPCCDMPTAEPECTAWQTETAYGGAAAGAGSAWWYYFNASGNSVQNIYAGQNELAGTVKLEGGVLTITLTNGWELQEVAEPVKIQGYNTLPKKRPAAGQFTTYKGTSLSVSVAAFSYYVIHLDVKKCTSFN